WKSEDLRTVSIKLTQGSHVAAPLVLVTQTVSLRPRNAVYSSQTNSLRYKLGHYCKTQKIHGVMPDGSILTLNSQLGKETAMKHRGYFYGGLVTTLHIIIYTLTFGHFLWLEG